MAVLYKEDLVNPLQTGNFWLSTEPDVPGSRSWEAACARMVTWAQFRHPESNTRFYFFNTHFDHESETARQESASLLTDHVKKIAPEGKPVIVTGDFNAAAEEANAWKRLTEGGLTDIWLTAPEKKGPTLTFGGFLSPKGAEARAKSINRPFNPRRIDWILVRGPVEPLSVETVLYNQDGRFPSDHYPIAAKLRFGG